MGRYSLTNERTYITDKDIGAFTAIGAYCQMGGITSGRICFDITSFWGKQESL